MWWVRTWESSTEVRSVQSGVDLDLKLYSLFLCPHPHCYSRTPSSPQAIPSTTRNPSLHRSLLPSQEARQHEWQAGAGGGIWGLLAKRQTGAAPLESLKWQTLKRVWEEGEDRERWKHPPGWAGHRVLHISLLSLFIMPCQKGGFSSFLPSWWSFLKVLLQLSRTVDHFLILLLLPYKASQ